MLRLQADAHVHRVHPWPEVQERVELPTLPASQFHD